MIASQEHQDSISISSQHNLQALQEIVEAILSETYGHERLKDCMNPGEERRLIELAKMITSMQEKGEEFILSKLQDDLKLYKKKEYVRNDHFMFGLLHLLKRMHIALFPKVEETHFTSSEDIILQNVKFAMRLLILIFQSLGNKHRILKAATRFVEGGTVEYITGSGQTKETRKRVALFEEEARKCDDLYVKTNRKLSKRSHDKTQASAATVEKSKKSKKRPPVNQAQMFPAPPLQPSQLRRDSTIDSELILCLLSDNES